MEPEKKDVWEEFDEKISFANRFISISDEGEMKLNEDKHFYYSDAYPESIWELDSDKIKSFIKTHFIPRAEVEAKYENCPQCTGLREEFRANLVEKIEKIDAGGGGSGRRLKVQILDLIKTINNESNRK